MLHGLMFGLSDPDSTCACRLAKEPCSNQVISQQKSGFSAIGKSWGKSQATLTALPGDSAANGRQPSLSSSRASRVLVLHSNQLNLGSIVRGPAFEMTRLTLGTAPVAVIPLPKTGAETKSHCFGPTVDRHADIKSNASPIRITTVPTQSSLARRVIMLPNAAAHLPPPERQVERRKDTRTTPSRRAESAGGG